ncbi:MAG TPA: ABC transporter substrate-binding protein [Candidatus Binatia bacterium]|nr:ABC transporter substrate-binding protein [Candidatus Binatia bacterium]
MPNRIMTASALVALTVLTVAVNAVAQEKIRISYSSADATNAVYFIAQDRGLYKKYGVDTDLVFIQSTPISVTSIIAGDVKVGNAAGNAVASAVIGGVGLVMVACYINTLPYELVVQESVRTAEDLRGKSIGISRIGSASDTAAHVLIRGLGLTPVKDVPIIQVGGPGERAAAFRGGRIVGFPSPPGVVKLAQGMPHKVLISTADLPKRFDFPYICANTTRPFLTAQRETVRRIVMALIDATHFFKTRKDETKKIVAKYSRQDNEGYLEDSWQAMAKLYERVPLVTRPGMEAQIQEAARKPGANLKFEDIVDESIVRELDKSGFIGKVYNP